MITFFLDGSANLKIHDTSNFHKFKFQFRHIQHPKIFCFNCEKIVSLPRLAKKKKNYLTQGKNFLYRSHEDNQTCLARTIYRFSFLSRSPLLLRIGTSFSTSEAFYWVLSISIIHALRDLLIDNYRSRSMLTVINLLSIHNFSECVTMPIDNTHPTTDNT